MLVQNYVGRNTVQVALFKISIKTAQTERPEAVFMLLALSARLCSYLPRTEELILQEASEQPFL
jgi:hypothetical protein